jgi:hypothetical protein
MKKRGPKKLPDNLKKYNLFELLAKLTSSQLDVLNFEDIEKIRFIMISEGFDKDNLTQSIQGIADRVLSDKLNKSTDGEIS